MERGRETKTKTETERQPARQTEIRTNKMRQRQTEREKGIGPTGLKHVLFFRESQQYYSGRQAGRI